MKYSLILVSLIALIPFSCAQRQGANPTQQQANPIQQPTTTQACTGTMYQGICYPGGDSDGDGASDTFESTKGSSPLKADSDDDGANDFCEILKNTDPNDKDQKPENCDFIGGSVTNGKAGVSCWDLNANGIPDKDSEDSDKDGNVNVQDCQAYLKEECGKDEKNCVECKKNDEGKCVVIKNFCDEVELARPTNCKEKCSATFGGKDDILKDCNERCDQKIKIPSGQSNCSLMSRPPSYYKTMRIEVTACINGYHVLTPTLHSLSWQTINIYDFYVEEGEYGKVNAGTAEIDDEGNVDVGFAKHCQESNDKDFFNKAYVKIYGKEKTWNYPAYNSFDLWQYLEKDRRDKIDTTQEYFIVLAAEDEENGYFVYDLDEYEDEGGNPKNGNEILSLIRTLYEPTSSPNGQVKTMIETIVLDNYFLESFSPIAQIAFDIYYAPIKEKAQTQ